MALIHEFILESPQEDSPYYYKNIAWREEYSYPDFENSNIPEVIRVPDDIIVYIIDSLKWIPTFNPSTKQNGYGLNYYGITVITSAQEHNGAAVARNIFNAWAELFSNGPEVINLTGSYTWIDDNRDGEYEKLEFKRDEIVYMLRKLAEYAEEVNKNGGQIIHFGI